MISVCAFHVNHLSVTLLSFCGLEIGNNTLFRPFHSHTENNATSKLHIRLLGDSTVVSYTLSSGILMSSFYAQSA